jgi:hypothetical protein
LKKTMRIARRARERKSAGRKNALASENKPWPAYETRGLVAMVSLLANKVS